MCIHSKCYLTHSFLAYLIVFSKEMKEEKKILEIIIYEMAPLSETHALVYNLLACVKYSFMQVIQTHIKNILK